MPFTLRNLKADLEDVGSNFDGAPDLEFRMATDALELEQSGLSYQSCSARQARTRGCKTWRPSGAVTRISQHPPVPRPARAVRDVDPSLTFAFTRKRKRPFHQRSRWLCAWGA